MLRTPNLTRYLLPLSFFALLLIFQIGAPTGPVSANPDLNILCLAPEPNPIPPGYMGPCSNIPTLFPNTTIIGAVADFPADLSPYDLVVVSPRNTSAFVETAGQLIPYVQTSGGLLVIVPSSGAQPFPAGLELTVTSPFWPGFPSATPPSVQITSAGSSHPILDGVSASALAVNISQVSINSLGPKWTLLAQSVGHPHSALVVGEHGAGRLAVLTAAGDLDASGDKFARQLFEWTAGEGATGPAGPDMRIDAIEVTQAIQDLNNSVVLIAEKRTYVRVHVSAPERIDGVTATLSATKNGSSLAPVLIPLNPGGNASIDAIPDRGQLNDSFWFELPAGWLDAGTLMLTATLDPGNSQSDPNLANNVQSVSADFVESKPLKLRIYDVQYTANGATHQAGAVHLGKMRSWLNRAYPIPKLDAKQTTILYPKDGLVNNNELIAWLAGIRQLRQLFTEEAADTYYYGMVIDTGGAIQGNSIDIPGTVAVGPAGFGPDSPKRFDWDTDGSYGDWYAGHELGHLLGRHHAEHCGASRNGFGDAYPHAFGRISPTLIGKTAIYGFDIYNQTIYDPNWKDVMTYCDKMWISDFTYEGILDTLVASRRSSISMITADEFLLLSGTAGLSDSSVQQLDIQRIAQTGTVPLPQPGTWSIVLLDAADNTLAVYPFAPLRLSDIEEVSGQPALISAVVPWAAGTTKVEIRDGSNVVTTKGGSTNAPTVSITSPTVNQQLGSGMLTFSWVGNDADGDTLTYSVLYSHDGGNDWEVLTADSSASTLTIDGRLLGGSDSGSLRVIVSDGFLTGSATVGPFTLPSNMPEATILSPGEGITVFYTGQLVTLNGAGYDLEDGELEGSTLRWASSIDGDLGAGALVQTADLTLGNHTLTLTATDSDGAVSTAQQTIWIIEDGGEAVLPERVFLPFVIR